MPVSEIEIDGRRFFRVEQKIGGDMHQEDIPIPGSLKGRLKARKAADDMDVDLLNKLALFRARKARDVDTYLKPDGKIIGISRRRRERAGRPPEDAFYVQVYNRHKKGQDRAFFETAIHGELEAFELSLGKWVEFRGLEPHGMLHQALRAQLSAYSDAPAPSPANHLPTSTEDLESAIMAEIERFQARKRAGVITGFKA